MKKLLAILLLLALCTFLFCACGKKDWLGTWQTVNDEILEVTETHIILQGIAFPYERGRGNTFVMVAGSLGPLCGSYHIEDGCLYLTIDGAEELFYRR